MRTRGILGLLVIGLLFGSFVFLSTVNGIPDKGYNDVVLNINTGTPDSYGNQILNVTIDQDIGGGYEKRGVITSSNYSSFVSIAGLEDQNLRFTVVTSLNYSFGESYDLVNDRSNLLLTVDGEFSDLEMPFINTKLININNGWISTYIYEWVETGKPTIKNYNIQFEFYGTGTSNNYNLTFYDGEFSTEYVYENDMSNVTWDDAKSNIDNHVVVGGGNKFNTTSGTSGYVRQDNLGIDFYGHILFYEVSITYLEVGSIFKCVAQNSSGTYKGELFTGINTVGIHKGTVIQQDYNWDEIDYLRYYLSGSNDVYKEMQIDYFNFYTLEDWEGTSYRGDGGGGQDVYKTINGVNITGVSKATDEYFGIENDITNLGINPDFKLIMKFRTSSNAKVSFWGKLVNGSILKTDYETSMGWKIATYDVLFTNTLSDLDIFIQSQDNNGCWVEVMYVYVESFGAYNQSLVEVGGGNFRDYDADFDTVERGYWESDGGLFYEEDFIPLNNLGNVTIVIWTIITELQYGVIFLSQYVDSNNLIEVGFEGGNDVTGGIYNFTIGNGTHSETARVKVTEGVDDLKLHCIIASWDKNDYLTLTIDGVSNTSLNKLNGVIKANSELVLGGRNDGNAQIRAFFGVSLYYYSLSNSEKAIIYTLGQSQTFEYFHHWGFNEILTGYGATSTALHDSDSSNAKREMWSFNVGIVSRSAFLFPWFVNEPNLYVWLFSIFGMVIFPPVLIFVSKDKDFKKRAEMYLLGGIVMIILFSIFITGVY